MRLRCAMTKRVHPIIGSSVPRRPRERAGSLRALARVHHRGRPSGPRSGRFGPRAMIRSLRRLAVRRTVRVAGCSAAMMAGFGAADADASQVGLEGAELVARADAGETTHGLALTVNAAAGTATVLDVTEERDPVFAAPPRPRGPGPAAASRRCRR